MYLLMMIWLMRSIRTSYVPVEEPAISVPVEESTIDHPVEVSTTDVQVEQSKMRQLIKVEMKGLNGKIVFNPDEGKKVAEDMLPKDGDM